MARFAKISSDNIVLDTLTLEESYMRDENGDPQESIGQAYLETNNNWPAAQWIQDTEARKNGPGIGMEWDSSNQIFFGTYNLFNSWTKKIFQMENGKHLFLSLMTYQKKRHQMVLFIGGMKKTKLGENVTQNV
jgi:hypothetical protein